MAKKNLEYYMNLPYTVTVKRSSDTGSDYWIARVLELPHCMTHGTTPEEALRDIEDAKREWLMSSLKSNLRVPEPVKYSGQYHLRMPPSLHEALAIKSETEDISLNQLIITALARSVGCSEQGPLKSKRLESANAELAAGVKEARADYKAGKGKGKKLKLKGKS